MMTNKETCKKTIDSFMDILLIISMIINACLIIYILYNKSTTYTSSPVEEMNRIDSTQLQNTKLITEINILDSTKNNKIHEVKKLNNDSTFKLFYELISTK